MARTQGSRAEITGPLIRDAALRLFARRGYAAVSMRAIAADVGLQVGTLYAYTPDKEALLMDLLRGHMEALLSTWSDEPGDPLIRLERFVRFHVRMSLERADAVFLSYMELRNLSPGNFAEIARLRRAYEDALQSILEDGRRAGVMQVADARVTTMALIAMLTGVTTWYRSGGRLDAEGVAAVYWDLVRNAVGG